MSKLRAILISIIPLIAIGTVTLLNKTLLEPLNNGFLDNVISPLLVSLSAIVFGVIILKCFEKIRISKYYAIAYIALQGLVFLMTVLRFYWFDDVSYSDLTFGLLLYMLFSGLLILVDIGTVILSLVVVYMIEDYKPKIVLVVILVIGYFNVFFGMPEIVLPIMTILSYIWKSIVLLCGFKIIGKL